MAWLRLEVIGDAAGKIGHAAAETVAEAARVLARVCGRAELLQVAQEFFSSLARTVQHEMNPGPGVAVFFAAHAVERFDGFQLFQPRELAEAGGRLDNDLMWILFRTLLTSDLEILGQAFIKPQRHLRQPGM